MSPMAKTLEAGAFPKEMEMADPIINVLLFFDSLPEDVASTWAREFEANLWPAQRFSSRMDGGYWVQEQKMDAAYHFTEVSVEDEAAIDAHVQGSFLEKLDSARPPWRVVFLRAPAPSRSAAYIRVHHSIGDGLGLLFALSPLCGCEGDDPLGKIPLPAALLPGKRPKQPAKAKEPGAPKPKPKPGCCQKTGHFSKGFGVSALTRADSELSINPPLADRTPLLRFNRSRAVARFPPVDMSLVKRVREKYECSVNDVIMAALAGALRRFGAEAHNDERLKGGAAGKKLDCKAMMMIGLPRPVNPEDLAGSISNRHLYASCPLPVHEPEPARRVEEILRVTGLLKSVPYMAGLRCFTDMITKAAPASVLRKAVGETFSKHSLLVTCLPGPTVPITFPKNGGEVIREIQMVFPNIITQVSIITYDGFVHANVVADPALFPRPEDLGRMWAEEFDVLLAGSPAPAAP